MTEMDNEIIKPVKDIIMKYLDYKWTLKFDIVINAIGRTGKPNIDWCETHKVKTYESNVLAAGNLALTCADLGVYFVHLSSGCIYSNSTERWNFPETATPSFFGHQVYADSKIIAEKLVSQFPSLILRLRMPFCSYPHPRNLIDKLKGYKKVLDVQNSMTCLEDFLFSLKKLVEQRAQGIFNVVNPGSISPYSVMLLYREYVDPTHDCEPIWGEELNELTKAERSNCTLSTQKLEAQGIHLPSIRTAVITTLIQYAKETK